MSVTVSKQDFDEKLFGRSFNDWEEFKTALLEENETAEKSVSTFTWFGVVILQVALCIFAGMNITILQSATPLSLKKELFLFV